MAWVTAGFLHIPHAEDIPNTVTVGNGVGFFLRPYNFFDQEPSMDSADSIYFREGQDAGSCEVNPLACLPQAPACVPDLPAFSHGGFSHNQVVLGMGNVTGAPEPGSVGMGGDGL